MGSNSFSKFSSERVEGLAMSVVQKMCEYQKMTVPAEEESRIIVNSRDMKGVNGKITVFSRLRHRGRFGQINEQLQDQLNLRLLIQDLLNEPSRKKRDLIRQVVLENDKLVQSERIYKFNQDVIARLMKDGTSPSRNFEWLLRKADNLLTIQKSRLRARIDNDDLFESAFGELCEIYQTHLQQALRSEENRANPEKTYIDSMKGMDRSQFEGLKPSIFGRLISVEGIEQRIPTWFMTATIAFGVPLVIGCWFLMIYLLIKFSKFINKSKTVEPARAIVTANHQNS